MNRTDVTDTGFKLLRDRCKYRLVAAQHAYDALYTRMFGVPALAPYFHFAFGWGIPYCFP